jgi:hypothetical protein
MELSMLMGENLSRMEIWSEISACDIDPRDLTKDQALWFLRRPETVIFLSETFGSVDCKKLFKLAEKLDKWDPNSDTPEEIFERISKGLFGNLE